MKNSMSRREFLAVTIKAGTALTLGSTLLNLAGCFSADASRPNLKLVKDPKGICDLPEGFSYTIISKEGETMSDGLPVPDRHDGMGCFAGPDGEIILVRNHEMPLYFPSDPPSPLPDFAYDPKSAGGTVTIWLNDKLEVIRHHLSLTGTIRNCAGGTTPWGTWISCEEANEGWFMGKRHGYNFEVNPLQPIRKAIPLKAMGRFNHEAVAVDPRTGIVYQTEDDMNSCFYRFLPNEAGRLEQGGRLQALKIVEGNISHTTDDPMDLGRKHACEWVDIDDPDPEENTVRKQGQAKGAAVFVRGEGCAAHDDGIYFTCTNGGKKGLGQVFKYTPGPDNESGFVELVYESSDAAVLQKPDNITVNAWGDLIICEDNSQDQRCLLGITPEGKVYYIASNTQAEWAGACFSPDGETLFANIHKKPGMTVAIRGPWGQLRRE